MKFEDTKAEQRWLILSDKNQKFPVGNLQLTKCEKKKAASGTDITEFTLSHRETGNEFKICAWKRDVLSCIEQYGLDTDSWGDVQFEMKNDRWQLVPAPMLVLEEKVE